MLESQTFRFRDPLNKDRRFIPLRLDHAPIKGSLAQFLYINWLPASRELDYAKLLDACRPPAKQSASESQAVAERVAGKIVKPGKVLQFPKVIGNDAKLPKHTAKSGKRDYDTTVHRQRAGVCPSPSRGETKVTFLLECLSLNRQVLSIPRTALGRMRT